MALILLAFIGTLAIFFRIWRELDGLRRALDEIRDHAHYAMADADQQHRELVNLVCASQGVTAPQPAPARDPAGDNLGTLLEKGLPNLVGNPAFGGMPSRDFRHLSAPAAADREEEDFLRRLQTGPGDGSGAL